MHRLKDMSWNALWSRPVEQQVQEELEFYREEFGMIMSDVSALPNTSPIIVEGAALLPEKVEQLVPGPIMRYGSCRFRHSRRSIMPNGMDPRYFGILR